METNPIRSGAFARFVYDGAYVNGEHVGNRLMDTLSPEVADVVREQTFNPRFIDDMTLEDVIDWVNHHVLFDDKGNQVAVSDGCEILWKAA